MARRKTITNGETDPLPEAIPNTNPEDTAECFLELKEIDSHVAALGQKKARTIGRFRNLGVDTDAVRECIKLEHQRDAPEWIKRVIATAAILNIIPTDVEDDGQVTFMPGLRTPVPSTEMQEKLAEAKAYSDGYNGGRHGNQSADDNPHVAGSKLYQVWGQGCLDGQAEKAIAKANRKPGRTGRAATAEPTTALEQDEAAYRGTADQELAAEEIYRGISSTPS